jgi:hypothetical protein
MSGHLFLAQGDVTQVTADAAAYSTSTYLGRDGNLCSSFEANLPGFKEAFSRLMAEAPRPVEIGASHWLPLRDDGLRGVVVVASTGRGEGQDKPGLAVRNALRCAVDNLRVAGVTRRVLIALPGFRVGQGGDHSRRLDSARAQVRAARSFLDEVPGVDAAFILYTPAMYRIFLEARREVLGACGPSACPALEQSLREGTCVLFAGAGLSSGAGLPTWAGLIDRLGLELGIENASRFDALDVAQWYRSQMGAERLASVLREAFEGSGTPTLAHYLLLSLPVRHVITTNYDGLIERALNALKRHPVPVVKQEDVARTGSPGGVFVTKLHGDVASPAEIVLARDDYDTFLERRPAMALLLEGLMLNQTFFFVGYSLRDPNFRAIFGRVARMLRESRRPAFATSFEQPGPAADLAARQWRSQGLEMIPISGEEKNRAFQIYLDGLAERVTLQAPPLILAADTPTPAPLTEVFAGLSHVGELAEDLAAQGGLDEVSVRFLGDLVGFLAAHGWRPAGRVTLAAVWRRLAVQARSPELKRHLLASALGASESLSVSRSIRAELDQLGLKAGSTSRTPSEGAAGP